MLLLLACSLLAGCGREPPRKIVLIGGAASEAPGRHDYPDGIRALQALLEASPDARKAGVEVVAFPDGWPEDASALEGAHALVWYFDGLDRHPLTDPARRAQVEWLVREGVGLVALHQASTVPTDDDLGLREWLGAVRAGTFDRTTQWARIEPAVLSHPVVRGLQAFEHRDEFYPTLRFAPGALPVLVADLDVQYRQGARLVETTPGRATVAWTYTRPGGGRSFGFTGTHFLAAFDDAAMRKVLLNAMLWSAGTEVRGKGSRDALGGSVFAHAPEAPQRPRVSADWPTFQRDPLRSGWDDGGNAPSRTDIVGGSFGLAWESPRLDGFEGHPPRLYASPLYLDALRLGEGPLRGDTFPAVIAASNTGYVYAVNAATVADVAAGRILWRTRLGAPCRLQPSPLDGVPTGILSTPVIDVARGRLYVTHCDPANSWQAYALDVHTGHVLPGWPVRLDEDTLNAVNRNAGPRRVPPRRKHDFRVQRAALNLSPDGTRLYVGFGETETGWTVSVDTVQARVRSAFASQAMPHRGAGGIWGSGGPAVDDDGHVYVVTGSGFEGYKDQPHDWTQSVMKLSDEASGLTLRGTYTPFNHCRSATADIDLGSGGAMLVPALPGEPRLMVVGGKQGNAYLLDRDRLPGRLDSRPRCDTPSSQDGSLLPPQVQPQFGARGPLNAFGPYSEDDGAMDIARARSVPAFFRDAQGRQHVFLTGNTRRHVAMPEAKPPSLVRLQIERHTDASPYLRIAARQDSEVMLNPGPPMVTSRNGQDAIVWVLDENARRSTSLAGDDAPRPVLYAFDADTLTLLWRSAPGQLYTSGKYNAPAFARGTAFVGTDRIQAFRVAETLLSGGAATAPAPALPSRLEDASEANIAAVDAAALYAARCAACHDHPFGNIPPRSVIAAHPLPRIVEALSHGAMRVQASGLTSAEIQALGRYMKQ
ncbi:ThuA domain-containing protein [Luteimonas aestuarii]|uniref:ThuA domain-containing protein n=1 Tax=Luteimonas aestuarii TaxID=453837 RepID=UPI0014051F58|nr:ThuA domain-containing protein [Luteimonas aestuarii]